MSRAEDMRELFARWRSSGKSLMAFGKSEGVSYAKLLYWRRKLENEEPSKQPVVAEAPELVPVEIVAEAKPADTTSGKFEVWFTNGVSLDVTSGFDADELRRLVGVLLSC